MNFLACDLAKHVHPCSPRGKTKRFSEAATSQLRAVRRIRQQKPKQVSPLETLWFQTCTQGLPGRLQRGAAG